MLGREGLKLSCPRGWTLGDNGHQGAAEDHLCPQQPTSQHQGACVCQGVGQLQLATSGPTPSPLWEEFSGMQEFGSSHSSCCLNLRRSADKVKRLGKFPCHPIRFDQKDFNFFDHHSSGSP